MLNSLESLPHMEDRIEKTMIRHNPEMFLNMGCTAHFIQEKNQTLLFPPEVSEFTLELDQ